MRKVQDRRRENGEVTMADLYALFGGVGKRKKRPKVRLCSFFGCRRLSLRDRCEVHRR